MSKMSSRRKTAAISGIIIILCILWGIYDEHQTMMLETRLEQQIDRDTQQILRAPPPGFY